MKTFIAMRNSGCLQAPSAYAMKRALLLLGADGFSAQYNFSNFPRRWKLTEQESRSNVETVSAITFTDDPERANDVFSNHSLPTTPVVHLASSTSVDEFFSRPENDMMSFSMREDVSIYFFKDRAGYYYCYEPQKNTLKQIDNGEKEDLKSYLTSTYPSWKEKGAIFHRRTQCSTGLGDFNLVNGLRFAFAVPHKTVGQGIGSFLFAVVSPVVIPFVVLAAKIAALAALIKLLGALIWCQHRDFRKESLIDAAYLTGAAATFLLAAPVFPILALTSFLAKLIANVAQYWEKRAENKSTNGMSSSDTATCFPCSLFAHKAKTLADTGNNSVSSKQIVSKNKSSQWVPTNPVNDHGLPIGGEYGWAPKPSAPPV